MCGESEAKSPHHIIPRSEGGEEVPENIVFLCKLCHDEVEEDPKLWARFLRHDYASRLRQFRRETRKRRGQGKPPKSARVRSIGPIGLLMEELGISEGEANAVVKNLAKAQLVGETTVINSLRKRNRGITDYRTRENSALLETIKGNLTRRRSG